MHDISSGGILLTLSEMCISSNIGAKIKIPKNNLSIQEYLFGEDQSRYIIEVSKKNLNKVIETFEKNNTYYEMLGKTQKETLELENELNIKVYELYKLNTFWFNNYYNEV